MQNEDLTRTLELVRRAQAGDGESLERLLARYYDRVRRIVRLRLGKKLREKLESGDILQEVFLDAVNRFDRFEMRDEASLLQWLSRKVEWQIGDQADRLSAAKRDAHKETPLDAPAAIEGEEAAAAIEIRERAPQPFEEASSNEDRETVEACMEQLSEEYRELIILRDYVGYSWEEIAAQARRPSAGAARMMHAKAMIELGKLLRRRRAPDR
jgi:RNA polymerase sigma-70 factor (ECF subfamily)